jgi:tetratricopeptide (TPR) repeat protein
MRRVASVAKLLTSFSLLPLAVGALRAAVPSDCAQSDYPLRVIPACTEILGRDPSNAAAYFKRGKAYLDGRTDTRDVDRAIADLTKSIELEPGRAEAYNLRGIAFRRVANFPRAIADHSKAIELDPAFARAYRSRGTTYHRQHDYDRALADFDKAIELEPGAMLGYFDRAISYDAKGDTGRAIDDLKQAFKLGLGDSIEAIAEDDQNETLALLTKAIERDGKDAIAYYGRGRMHAINDEWERAIADYGSALEHDPTLVEAYTHRSRAYAELKYDDPRALADANRAIELDPKNARGYVARGMFHLDQVPPVPERALADFTKAIEVDPRNAYAYMHRALLHAIEGDHAAAKADIAKAIELDWRLWGMMLIYPDLLKEVEAERDAARR